MQERNPPSTDVWIDERLAVADSSIDGRGLFFSSDVESGVVVLRLGGRLVSSRQLAALIASAGVHPESAYVDTITVWPDQHLVLPGGTSAHFGNHSCDPTLWHVGPYELATRLAVSAGDEATIDYGTHSGAAGFRMECHCGAPPCRGVITSDDWRRPELQHRYAGHWVPALEALIRTSHGKD